MTQHKISSPNKLVPKVEQHLTPQAWLGLPPQEAFHKLILAYQELLNLPQISNDIGKEHIKTTPLRVVKALSELLSGYTVDPEQILKTSFKEGKYDEMICVNDIGFCSLCAHHMLPFTGKVHFAYIPNGKVVGLSKIPRMVEAYSRRLQVQERLVVQLVETFQSIVKPKGCAALIEAHHMCCSIRGIRKETVTMRSVAIRGIFKRDPSAKAEFLASIK